MLGIVVGHVGMYSENEFFWNLYANTRRIPEQIQHLAEFIYAIQHTSASACFSVMVKRIFRIRYEIEMRKV